MEKIKRFVPLAFAMLPLLVFYFVFGCPIKFFTGISCLGCGMSRAAISLLSFDVQQAVYYHPLIFLMPVTAVILLLRNRLPKKVCSTIFWVVAVMFVVVYVYRMFFLNSDVVCFAPAEGFIYKFIAGSGEV